jgi:hypothetical protein
MTTRFRIPLRVGVPIVVLSGIVGVAAGVWLPVTEAPAPPPMKQAAPVRSEPLGDAADPAPQPPPEKQATPAMPDPLPRAAAVLPPPPEEEPEPASRQLALSTPGDEVRHEPEQHVAPIARAPTANTADTGDDGPAKDNLETPRFAPAPEAKSPAFSSKEQSERSERPVVAQSTVEKKQRPPRRAASAPTRRTASAQQRRDDTTDARDRPPRRPDRPRPVLSQLPIIGPVFGLFTP